MQVIAVVDVGVGSQDRRECAAGAGMHVAQEGALAGAAPPAPFDGHPMAVGELKGGHVEGVGVGVLRDFGADDAIARPAGVGGSNLDLDDGLSEMTACAGLDDLGHPLLDGRYHLATQKRRGTHGDAAAKGTCHLERIGYPAAAGTAERSALDEIWRGLSQTHCHAPLVLGAPPAVGHGDGALGDRAAGR